MSTLTIRVDGVERSIAFTLKGVEEANLSVWSGSIVSEILIFKVGDMSFSSDGERHEIWSYLFDSQLFDKDIEGETARIIARSPDSFIFALLCSYGGTLACVADDIIVS
jgi:hypothetical protein